jgi:hypothetical protein
MTSNTKKIINTLVKIVLGGGAILFIAYKISLIQGDDSHILDSISNWWKNKRGDLKYFPFLLFLVLIYVNWWVETRKWKVIVGKLQPVNNKLAWKSILSGEAAGVFTSFGIGTYLGRVIHLSFRNRISAAILISLGNISQFSVAYIGSILASFFFFFYSEELSSYFLILSVLGVVFFAVYILAFINIQKILPYLERFKFTKRWRKIYNIIQQQSHEHLVLKVLLLSAIRYLVIMLQYLLLFWFFDFNYPLHLLLAVLPILFLLVKLLPTLSLFELGATKASIFILLFEFIYGSSIADGAIVISMVSLLIWFFNLLLPSSVGSIFLFQAKLLRT